jgi:hypothetical protein
MTKGRFISILIAGAWLWLGFKGAGGEGMLKVGMFLLLPMGCIWFGDELGSLDAPTSSGYLKASPGCLVALAGWLLLIVSFVVVMINLLRAGHG